MRSSHRSVQSLLFESTNTWLAQHGLSQTDLSIVEFQSHLVQPSLSIFHHFRLSRLTACLWSHAHQPDYKMKDTKISVVTPADHPYDVPWLGSSLEPSEGKRNG